MNYTEIIYFDVNSEGLVAKRSSAKRCRIFDAATSSPLNAFLHWINSIKKEDQKVILVLAYVTNANKNYWFIENLGKTLPEYVVFFDPDAILTKYLLIG